MDRSGPGWEVLAARYGRSEGFPLRLLVHGEADGVGHPMGWYFWILRGAGGVVLVDTGFSARTVARRWGIRDHMTAPDVLAGLGLEPDDVDHVVLTHSHWDHAGGIADFGRAVTWIRRAELDWLGDCCGARRPSEHGVRRAHLAALRRAEREGRLRVVGDGDVEALPGLTLSPGGRHTPGGQWVQVRSGGEVVVLGGDDAYLYRNVDELAPIGNTDSVDANRDALRRMRAAASHPDLVVPGHDPAVAERHPEIAPRVHRIHGLR